MFPTHFELELNGTVSRFDPGWSGAAHGVGLPTGSNFSVEVTSCDSDCRRCQFHGPVASDPVFPVNNRRCLSKVTQTCTADAECGAMGPCRFLFPPIAAELIVPTCSIAYLEPLTTGLDQSPVQGVIDLDTGETDMSVMNLFIKLGIEGCRSCQGDTTANDRREGRHVYRLARGDVRHERHRHLRRRTHELRLSQRARYLHHPALGERNVTSGEVVDHGRLATELHRNGRDGQEVLVRHVW